VRLVSRGPIPGPSQRPRPYAEFRVGFVVARLQGADRSPRARLDGMEASLTRLISRWRAGERLSAARDLRMAPATLDEVVAWIEGDEWTDADLVERLGVYQSGAVADPAVPRGWIRVYLGVGWAGPGHLRAGEG
jgi:hypothetical protein